MSDHALAVLGLIAAILFGVAALALAYYLYRRALERIDIRYVLGYETLFDGRAFDPPLIITFKEDSASILRRCSIALWNVGRRPVRAADILDSDPLRIEIPSSTIVGTMKRASVRPPLEISAGQISGGSVELTFEFLDQGDGGIVDIIYTGPDDAVPVLRGKIRGLPRGAVTAGRLLEVQGKPAKPKWHPKVNYIVWLMRVALVLAILLAIAIVLPEGPLNTVLVGANLTVFFGAYFSFIYLFLQDRPRSVPKQLWSSMIASYSRFTVDDSRTSTVVRKVILDSLGFGSRS